MAAMTECPTCRAAVPLGAASCPTCGASLTMDVAAPDSTSDAKPSLAKRGLRERILFYAGLTMVLVGGPAIAVGSWLHDVLRIPIGGDNYEAFGWFNRIVSAIGLVLLLTGIMVLIISLRMSRPVGDDYDVGAYPEGQVRE